MTRDQFSTHLQAAKHVFADLGPKSAPVQISKDAAAGWLDACFVHQHVARVRVGMHGLFWINDRLGEEVRP